VAAGIHGLGDVALEEGNPKQALARYGRDLVHFLGGIAAACAALGRLDDAARLWGAVKRLDEGLELTVDRSLYEGILGDLDPEQVALGGELGRTDALALAREVSRASGS
jgi:hypothetical protein